MTDYARIERTLVNALGLPNRPIAIAIRDTPPPGVARVAGSHPSGCSFWRLAAEGRVFYTVPEDHHNCPIGSYTHNMPLPAARASELTKTLTFMTGIGYLKMEEVPGIPTLPSTPGVVVYAPLGETPVDPDAVLFMGAPGRLMLLHEAALRAGITSQPALLGRPTCMAVPAALGDALVSSLGCVGNRVYTDLPDSDYYVSVTGSRVAALAAEVGVIASANATLAEYHRGRRAAIA